MKYSLLLSLLFTLSTSYCFSQTTVVIVNESTPYSGDAYIMGVDYGDTAYMRSAIVSPTIKPVKELTPVEIPTCEVIYVKGETERYFYLQGELKRISALSAKCGFDILNPDRGNKDQVVLHKYFNESMIEYQVLCSKLRK
ncbi:MAG: hypothetical protein ACKOXB_08835 [Flavobacteriales bacterium]